MRFTALVVAIMLAAGWVLLGVTVGLDYALANAGTAKSEAPPAAVLLTLYGAPGGAVLLIAAAALNDASRPYGARRCAAGAAACFVVWGIARVILASH